MTNLRMGADELTEYRQELNTHNRFVTESHKQQFRTGNPKPMLRAIKKNKAQ